MEHSIQINELVVALIAAKGEFGPVVKDKVNPYYNSKYADLSTIIEATEEALASNGLEVLQFVQTMETGATGALAVGCTTMLAHVSGQWMKASAYLPLVKQDPQQAGSAITYCRRYSLSALLGIAADDDDDANTAIVHTAGRNTELSLDSDLEF